MPYSLLHISALRNDINAATDYLEGGAPDTIHVWEDQDKRLATVDAIEVDVRDDQGWTPLMCAATHGHVEMCELLLDFGADVNARKNFSVAALHLASRNGHASVIKSLIENSADIFMEKVDSGMPIHDAAFGGHVECAKMLLEAGAASSLPADAHLSKRLDDGATPLHVASRRGHPEMVTMLVEAGASLLAKDENNKQPHEVAKNRRTLICFPRVIDPAEMQVAEVGAMAKDVIDYVKPLTNNSGMGKARHSSVSTKAPRLSSTGTGEANSPIVAVSPSDSGFSSTGARPRTSGEIGNFTSSLGILREPRR